MALFLLAGPACVGKGTRSESGQDAPPALDATAPDRGFGTKIPWRSLDDGLARARARGQILMLVVHTSWCSRCRALKPAFSDPELVSLSESFVMVNLDQDEEERALEFAPDGNYIPRVIFIDPESQRPIEKFRNAKRSSYKYFYTAADEVTKVMREAIADDRK